ncbi:PleD family two-component system response regulator [Leptolyngbya sp. 7M]|uniref:response regulator n=1 Tax=Leptolyngbya sp. 7M TaxID=2812896 RepID=UPI001CEDD371|nr:response regulator [Leptolyngbya sp. 7M]
MASQKILVIDDSRVIRNMVRDMLPKGNFQVLEAKDGVEGINCIRQERPNLIMLDFLLPRMSGWEVFQQIQSQADLQKIPLERISHPLSPFFVCQFSCRVRLPGSRLEGLLHLDGFGMRYQINHAQPAIYDYLVKPTAYQTSKAVYPTAPQQQATTHPPIDVAPSPMGTLATTPQSLNLCCRFPLKLYRPTRYPV